MLAEQNSSRHVFLHISIAYMRTPMQTFTYGYQSSKGWNWMAIYYAEKVLFP